MLVGFTGEYFLFGHQPADLILKSQSETNIKERKFGCAKGLLEMHEDFDEPLDDFMD